MSKDEKKDNAWVWAMLDAYLVKNKLKQTKQRKIILEVFMNSSESHLDAENVYTLLSKEHSNIGLATVYRSLNLLKDAGILDQHTFADGRAVFELVNPESHHDHLVCVTCGAIKEFENDEIESLQEQVAGQLGFELTSHRLELFGKCLKKDCSNKSQ
jgi:Fur family transcriptional regulator, ferric uptake regulator